MSEHHGVHSRFMDRTRLASLLLAFGIALTLGGILAPVVTAQTPNIPDAVAVELDPATTAYLVLDMTDPTCSARVSCMASIPAVAELLDRARASGAHVIYSIAGAGTILPELVPWESEPTVASRADKFYGTDLEEILRARGVTTAVIVGTAANGAVLYTTFGANLRGFTVVVAEDGISSDDPFAVLATRFQLLNQPGFANPGNTPLAETRATLSRTDLITFR